VKYLHELPVIFVNYTWGSGGLFLASLIQKWENPVVDLVIDNRGSGHANTYVQYMDNFYKDGLKSDIGRAIVHSKFWNQYSGKQRIEHLQKSKKIEKNNNQCIVISLHSADLEIFIEAFPLAKFVSISIDLSQLLTCRYNFLYKRMAPSPELFKNMAEEYQVDVDLSLEQIKNLNKINLEKLNWVDPEIIKFMPKVSYPYDNVISVTYDDYMFGDEIKFLDTIAEFLAVDINQEQFNQAVDHLVIYRLSQPVLPI